MTIGHYVVCCFFVVKKITFIIRMLCNVNCSGAVAFVSASVIASLVLSVITFVHIKDNGAHHHVEPLTTAASRSPISTALTFEPASTGTPAPLPSTAPHASSTVKTPPPVPPEPSTRQFSTDTPAPKTPSTRTASSASTTTSTVPSVTTPVTTPPPLRPHEGPVFCPNVGIANSSSAWQASEIPKILRKKTRRCTRKWISTKADVR